MKKIGVLLLIAFLVGCKTAPAVIPTTQYIDQAGTQASTIVTQTVTVEKLVTKMVVDEKAKTEALNAIVALKATAQEHVKTITTLKSVNNLVAQNYANMRTMMAHYRVQRNWLSIIVMIAALVVIARIVIKKIFF